MFGFRLNCFTGTDNRDPFVHGVGDELRSVVGPDVRRPRHFVCWLSSYEKPSAGGRVVVPGSIDRPQELALRLMAASRH